VLLAELQKGLQTADELWVQRRRGCGLATRPDHTEPDGWVGAILGFQVLRVGVCDFSPKNQLEVNGKIFRRSAGHHREIHREIGLKDTPLKVEQLLWPSAQRTVPETSGIHLTRQFST